MTITYSCIANGRVILAELALTRGSYQDAVSSVLKLVLLKAEKKTTARIGSYVYHTLLLDGITYLCTTDNPLDVTVPSAFLDEVSRTFSENPLMFQEPFPPSNSTVADFQQVLGRCMMKYNQSQGEFMISGLKSQVMDVKNSMSQNIDKMLKREEKLNILIDRTNNLQVANLQSNAFENPGSPPHQASMENNSLTLQNETKAFQKTTTKTSKKIWWRNYKIIIILSSIFIIIIIILLSTNVIPV